MAKWENVKATAEMFKTGTKGLMQVWCQIHQIWYSRGLDDCPKCAKFNMTADELRAALAKE